MEDENKCETLRVTNYLGLINVDVPDLPKDVVFPDELNRFLRDRIKYLNHENGMLQKTIEDQHVKLNESQMELKNLQKQLSKNQSSSSSSSFVSSSEVASSKIVELSKKLREKSSEIEVLKTKYSKLEKYLIEMQEQTEETNEVVAEKEIPKAEIEEVIKTVQNKLNVVTAKLTEARNANVHLKNQLKVANKCLQQEVGEHFGSSINKSNWRGRAQIICDLQQKNSELREKLKVLQEKEAKAEPNISTKHDTKFESLMQQNTTLIKKMQEAKNKLESTKARCKSLEMECTVYKTKLKSAQEQTEKDTQFLTSLTGQISYMQSNQTDSIKHVQKELQKVEAVNKNLLYELEQEKFKSDNLKKVIEEKDSVIAQLCVTEEPSNETPVATLFDRNVNQLENEKTHLLELISATKKKLEEERDAHCATRTKYAHEKQKAVKLETKLAKVQLEHGDKYSTCSGYSSKTSNKDREEMLQDKLEIAEENIKVLTSRLELEKEERNLDLQEFENILKNYKFNNMESSDE